jgi:hypothetical protein
MSRHAELLVDKGTGDAGNLFDGQRTGQLAGGFVKCVGALFADFSFPRFLFQAGGEMGGDQCRDQHYNKSDQVLQVADGKRKMRRDEKHVEQNDAEQRGKDGRLPAQADGNQ